MGRRCPKCGENNDKGMYCSYCGTSLLEQAPPRIVKRPNRVDESVREWFTSKTFKTILTIGLIGGLCFATCSFLFYGSLIGLLNGLLSPSPQEQSSIATQQYLHDQFLQPSNTQPAKRQPYIVRSTDESNPVTPEIKSALNAWVSTSAPVYAPYWFVTGWTVTDDGRVLVSLAGVLMSGPNEKWTLVNDTDIELPSKVMWAGSVEVIGTNVILYYP